MGYRDFLKFELELRRKRNPSYSLRAFARDLSIDHSTLSQWLRGKRSITRESLERLCGRLDLTDAERAFSLEFDRLALDLLQLIPSMFDHTAPTIAATLQESVDDVNISLYRLLRHGLLQLDGRRWAVTPKGEAFRIRR